MTEVPYVPGNPVEETPPGTPEVQPSIDDPTWHPLAAYRDAFTDVEPEGHCWEVILDSDHGDTALCQNLAEVSQILWDRRHDYDLAMVYRRKGNPE
jgi:hypothetical protein